MKVFRDAMGREWSYALNVATIKKVRDTTGIDLLQTDKSLAAVGEDDVALGEILWVLCKKEAEQRGITQEQFFEGLVGEALDQAREGFFREWVDFFPPSQTAKKTLLANTLEMAKAYNEACRNELERQFRELSAPGVVEKKVREELGQAIRKALEQKQENPPTPGS